MPNSIRFHRVSTIENRRRLFVSHFYVLVSSVFPLQIRQQLENKTKNEKKNYPKGNRTRNGTNINKLLWIMKWFGFSCFFVWILIAVKNCVRQKFSSSLVNILWSSKGISPDATTKYRFLSAWSIQQWICLDGSIWNFCRKFNWQLTITYKTQTHILAWNLSIFSIRRKIFTAHTKVTAD